MTDLDKRVVEMLREAVPQPPREFDPKGIRTGGERHQRRLYRYAPALAAAAVAATALSLYLVVRQSPEPKPAARLPTPTPPPKTTTFDPRAATERAVHRLFDATPIPRGATRAGHSPVRGLEHPASMPTTSHLIAAHGWWTTTASEDEVFHAFRIGLPAGIESSGSSNSGDYSGETVRGLYFDAKGEQWLRPTVYTQLQLQVTVAPLPSGGGTGIRVDAQAIWLPQRTASQRVPLGASSVDVVVYRTGYAPTVRRTLPAAGARELARAVNDLPVATPGIFFCPDSRGFTDTLRFHTARGVLTVRSRVDGCTGTTVSGPAVHGPALGGDVDGVLLRLLDVPRNYGSGR
jgi:hypothetical protein